MLDLDHTLLNSATYNELDQESGNKLEELHAKERAGNSDSLPPSAAHCAETEGADAAGGDGGGSSAESGGGGGGSSSSHEASGAKPLLHHLHHIHMWTKLRPHVHAFLQKASTMYELYVYTMGAKAYAAEMVALLDPDGTLGLRASDRVIGKEDSTAAHTKDLDVILGSERTTLIVDDSPAVWPQFTTQLLVPRRYHFFASSAARDSTLPGKATARASLSHFMAETDELAEHGQLHALLHALTKIHAHYFANLDEAAAAASTEEAADTAGGPPPHVSDSVKAVRRKVLRGVHLVFSHIIPLEQQHHPESHAAWQLASELGAVVHTTTSSGKVTHIIAGSDGTDKVKWAKAHAVPTISIARPPMPTRR